MIFDLSPGEVSAVVPGAGGYYIYKVLSKEVPPLDSVREQVQQTLASKKMEGWTEAITKSAQVELNEKYFDISKETLSPDRH